MSDVRTFRSRIRYRVLYEIAVLKRLSLWIFIIFVLAGFAIRIFNPLNYDLRNQHDPHFHINGLFSLQNGKIPDSYNPALYQAWYLAHNILTLPFQDQLNPEQNLRVITALGNLHLFFWLVFGLYMLGKQFGYDRVSIILWLAWVGSLVPIQRSLNMIRPENLQLAMAPWICYLGLRWVQGLKVCPSRFGWKLFALFQILSAAFLFQKVSAGIILAALYLYFLLEWAAQKRFALKIVVAAGIITLLLTFVLALGWLAVSGRSILDSPAGEANYEAYNTRPPVTFYYSVPLKTLFNEPYRERLRSSMLGILLADLYGDYWRYGYNHYSQTAHPEDDPGTAARQVTGVAVSLAVFGIVTILSVIQLVKNSADKRYILERLRIGTFVLFPALLSVLFFAAAAYTQFDPKKGNIIKWEYILFVLPFLPLPLAAAFSDTQNKYFQAFITFFSMVVLAWGIYQSLILY